MSKDTFDRVVDLLNHDRAETTWIVRPTIRYRVWVIDPSDGKYHPCVRLHAARKLAREQASEFFPASKPQIRREAAIVRMARIVRVFPRDGAGRLRIAVSDWGTNGDGDTTHFYGFASGYGYDKTAAALAGCTVGGVELGDHSDYLSRPVLRDLLRDRGWEAFGDAA